MEDLCRGQLGDQSFGCHGAWSLGLPGGACLGFSEGGDGALWEGDSGTGCKNLRLELFGDTEAGSSRLAESTRTDLKNKH